LNVIADVDSFQANLESDLSTLRSLSARLEGISNSLQTEREHYELLSTNDDASSLAHAFRAIETFRDTISAVNADLDRLETENEEDEEADDMPPLQPVETVRPKEDSASPMRTLHKTYATRDELMADIWLVSGLREGSGKAHFPKQDPSNVRRANGRGWQPFDGGP
jgi:hypothetical protein